MHFKFWQLFCISSLLSSLVVANAYYHRGSQFYPTIVYLTKSNASLTVLYIQIVAMVWALVKCCQKIMFGPLRQLEVEHVFEKSWYAITESALAFTVFRDEFSYSFVFSFLFLLAVKATHWITEDRVDLMERSPSLPNIFYARIISIMFLLIFVDGACVQYSMSYVMQRGPSVQLVFAFEYAVLYSTLFMIAAKYTLHTLDQRHRFGWDSKVVYMLYAELATSFFRLVLYTGFVSLMLSMKIFALFAIRPTYMAVRAFTKALTDVVRSRIAIRNLNTLFRDATTAELQALSDAICIICREEMAVEGPNAQSCKKLECGHIFHAGCLRSWFQRQQSCPTCRADVVNMRHNRDHQQQQQQQPDRQNRNNQRIQDAAQSPFTIPGPSGVPIVIPNLSVPLPPMIGFPLPAFQSAISPTPISAQSTQQMTIDQLKAREAALISEMEQRLKCLESVKQCLDASVSQLRTYMDLASRQQSQ